MTSTPLVLSTKTPATSMVVTTYPAPIIGSTFPKPFSDGKALLTLYPSGKLASDGQSIDILGDTLDSLYPGHLYTETLYIWLSTPFSHQHQQKHMLVLASSGFQGDCHACGAPLSASIFERHGDVWQLVTFSERFATLGSMGYPPSISRLVRIGPQAYGLLFLDYFYAQASRTTRLYLYTEIAGQWQSVLTIPELEYIQGADDELIFRELWGTKAYYSFVNGNNPVYFDLRIETYGRAWNFGGDDPTAPPTVPISQTQTYLFNGTEYVLP